MLLQISPPKPLLKTLPISILVHLLNCAPLYFYETLSNYTLIGLLKHLLDYLLPYLNIEAITESLTETLIENRTKLISEFLTENRTELFAKFIIDPHIAFLSGSTIDLPITI
jgi:hypothetical protein